MRYSCSKTFLIFVVCTALVFPCAVRAQSQFRDPAGGFEYAVPGGWKTVQLKGQAYAGLLERSAEGKGKRNIQINDQAGVENLEFLSAKYLKDFKQALPKFELQSQQMMSSRQGYSGVEIIHTNEIPGIPIRQINYILQTSAKKGYFITCTTLASDDKSFDLVCRDFVDSFRVGK